MLTIVFISGRIKCISKVTMAEVIAGPEADQPEGTQLET